MFLPVQTCKEERSQDARFVTADVTEQFFYMLKKK